MIKQFAAVALVAVAMVIAGYGLALMLYLIGSTVIAWIGF